MQAMQCPEECLDLFHAALQLAISKDALTDGVPMVIFSGQVPTGAMGTDAFQDVRLVHASPHLLSEHLHVVQECRISKFERCGPRLETSMQKALVGFGILREGSRVTSWQCSSALLLTCTAVYCIFCCVLFTILCAHFAVNVKMHSLASRRETVCMTCYSRGGSTMQFSALQECPATEITRSCTKWNYEADSGHLRASSCFQSSYLHHVRAIGDFCRATCATSQKVSSLA